MDWFRRQWPGVGRKDWAATKGKTTSISGFVYINLTSAALGLGVACYTPSRTKKLAIYTYYFPLLGEDYGASKKDEELS